MSILSYARSKRGQSVVEFTLAAPLFFLAFYAIIEFSHLFYVRSTLQHALDEAARYMSTGQGQVAGDSTARMNAIQKVFCNNLVATGITPCPVLQYNQCVPSDPDTWCVTASATKNFFSGFLGSLAPEGVQMTVSTIYKNEPFATFDTNGS
jgi:Flp pilus assembly protein TadG